ncbi:MAG: non-canonical purine NTP pyrophosphatase, partial [bacterium]
FRCALVFMRDAADRSPLISVAAWEGRILDAPLGDNGFGYDPVFQPAHLECSAAQLDAATKNRLSHRGKALRQLRAML